MARRRAIMKTGEVLTIILVIFALLVGGVIHGEPLISYILSVLMIISALAIFVWISSSWGN